jgi:hypothetical protein
MHYVSRITGENMIVDERLKEELKEIEARLDNIRGYL